MYLGKTRDLKITFGGTQKLPSYFQLFADPFGKNHGFHAFSDSSWGIPNPMAGFSVFMSGGVISYQARRIKSKLCVSGDSSCETKYAAPVWPRVRLSLTSYAPTFESYCSSA